MAELKEDKAAARFALIHLARLAGVAVAIAGLVLLGRTEDRWTAGLAILLVIGGVVASELVPRRLSRRWRTAGDGGPPAR